MKSYTSDEFTKVLIDIGISQGDTILVHNKLFLLGKLQGAKTKDIYMNTLFEAYFDAIGCDGTLAVGTFSTQTARYGDPFIYEESPCINGSFNQYILDREDSVRSIHPVNSFAAIGVLQDEICTNNGTSSFGIDSPLERLLKCDCELIFIDEIYHNSAFIHYIEQNCGLPYCYNKLLDIPVFKEGKKIDKLFTSNVRYLNYDIKADASCLKGLLDSRKLVRTEKLGGGTIHCISVKDYYNCALELVRDNPFALLSEPPNFVKGEIPFDGITTGRDGVKEGVGSLFRPIQ
jgi:aminoglycoside 3-N-acetyltransferase